MCIHSTIEIETDCVKSPPFVTVFLVFYSHVISNDVANQNVYMLAFSHRNSSCSYDFIYDIIKYAPNGVLKIKSALSSL